MGKKFVILFEDILKFDNPSLTFNLRTVPAIYEETDSYDEKKVTVVNNSSSVVYA